MPNEPFDPVSVAEIADDPCADMVVDGQRPKSLRPSSGCDGTTEAIDRGWGKATHQHMGDPVCNRDAVGVLNLADVVEEAGDHQIWRRAEFRQAHCDIDGVDLVGLRELLEDLGRAGAQPRGDGAGDRG